MKLRPYQDGSIEALFAYWFGGGENGLIVLPTAAGKSLVLSEICRRLLEQYPDMRIGVITHVKELIQQNAQEILRLWPKAPIGIYSAGLGKRDTRARIMFMGIQSVYNKTHKVGGFDLLLIDEAHLVGREATSMYGKFITSCREIVPDMRLCGLSATPYRLTSGMLHQGKDAIFDTIVYEANVRDLIEQGYLSNLISKATITQIDTKGLHIRAGEYIQSEIDERARIPTVVESAVKEIVDLGHDRKSWLIFCTGVGHAFQVRDEVRIHNISCETITGDTPAGDRDRIIRDYKAGKIRCLTSVGVLTTGFNAPAVDLIALLRPTMSTSLYVQMVGRGFRLHPGKDNCLVLDMAGVVARHGCIDDVRPRKVGSGAGKRSGEEEEATVRAKTCPTCLTYAAPNARICEGCGYEWPEPPARHEARAADDQPILTTEKIKPEFQEIIGTEYVKHIKPGSPPSLKVTYLGPFYERYSKWVCFEHTGYANQQAHDWWFKMGGNAPAPKNVDEALERAPLELRDIEAVKIRKVGKYPEILRVRFASVKEAAE